MTMKKSLRFVVLAILLLAISVGAASAQDKVTIHWWHISTGDPGLSFWQGLADAYTKAHPNVTFDITVLANEDFKSKLVTVMQAGDPPDLFQSWGGAVLGLCCGWPDPQYRARTDRQQERVERLVLGSGGLGTLWSKW